MRFRERRCSLAMLALGLAEQFREPRFPAERVEPGVAGHRRKTKEPPPWTTRSKSSSAGLTCRRCERCLAR